MRTRLSVTIVAMLALLLMTPLFEAYLRIEVPNANAKSASVTPSKYWGIFSGTTGDITFKIEQSGIAVRIQVPREFLRGVVSGENDTSFVTSTITNDYFLYSVIDESLHYPYLSYGPDPGKICPYTPYYVPNASQYDRNAPYFVEIHSRNATHYITFYASPSIPQYIYMTNLRAPATAGLYQFPIYIAKNTAANGLAYFPMNATEVVSVQVSIGTDPCSVSGYIRDSSTSVIIKTKGVVYATEVNTGARARAFVNSTTGFYNLTGLYAGTYELEASAGYCPDTGFAYVLTKLGMRIGPLSKGQRLYFVDILIDRGCGIKGTVSYNTRIGPVESKDHDWLKVVIRNIKIDPASVLNYTVEAYDGSGGIVGFFSRNTSGGTTDTFSLFTNNSTKYCDYPPYYTEYCGFGPGTYTLKAWVWGYVQTTTVTVTITTPTTIMNGITIPLYMGGVISGTIQFTDPSQGLRETPRDTERRVIGSATGKAYGGNIIVEARNSYGNLRGVCVINGTYPDGSVIYADWSTVKFYILGFSEFYNKSYSGFWIQKDNGLGTGTYNLTVKVRGYFQKSAVLVTVSEGSNLTVSVKLISGGAIRTQVTSWTSRPNTDLTQAMVAWRYPGYRMRIYYLRNGVITVGYNETVVGAGVTTIELLYSGNNWTLKQMVYFGDRLGSLSPGTRGVIGPGIIPSVLMPGNYTIYVYTYGYVQQVGSNAWIPESGLTTQAFVTLQIGTGVIGDVYLRDGPLYFTMTENASARVEVLKGSLLKGAQARMVPKGVRSFNYSIYGLTGGNFSHFYYVSPDGGRWDDYGMGPGNYTVRVPEFGYGVFGVASLQSKVLAEIT